MCRYRPAVFSRDGKGLQWRHTFFAADFMAEVMQGASELITSLLLLFLACGWTTVPLSSVGARLLGSLESGTSSGTSAGGDDDMDGRAGGKKSNVVKRMSKQVPDGIVAVVKAGLALWVSDWLQIGP